MTTVDNQMGVSLQEKHGNSSQTKRARMACDQCSVARTKCDGNMPCKRCSTRSLQCAYARQRKKRGKGKDRYLIKKSMQDSSNLQQQQYQQHEPHDMFGNGSLKPPLGMKPDLETSVSTFDSGSPHSSINSVMGDNRLVYPDANQIFWHNFDDGLPEISESLLNSPRWLNMDTTFSRQLFTTEYSGVDKSSTNYIKYPVLAPIVHELPSLIEPQLASDLLEVYFSNTVYGVAPIIRRTSLLSLQNRRPCSPALLYSFMLVSAHATENSLIKTTPSTRDEVIAKLTDLVTTNLPPLLKGAQVGTLDDVITFIHLGIVTSASELKGASIKWWDSAWGLARLLRLNQEDTTLDEEVREEQRRTWWLLYLFDRHLGLCYNRPLYLTNSECTELYTPANEEIWLSDEPLIPAEADPERKKGPPYTVQGTGSFGMYLPLMTILGGIIEIHFLDLYNNIGIPSDDLDRIRQNYKKHIDSFEESVEAYKQGVNQPSVYVLIWKEYCRFIGHVFYILLQGHWDPVVLLDSIGELVDDTKFDACIHHSIAAAKCIERILVMDPDLRLIPFFFGIQLLQAGFILLCMADNLERNANKEIRDACETMVRAHEVCIVTLNTEYQRNFRQILRGTLQAMVVPGMSHALEEGRARRRNLLALYRWTAGGTGLAI